MTLTFCTETQKRRTKFIMKIVGELALIGAIASVFVVAAQERHAARIAEETSAREYILRLDEMAGQRMNRKTIASWNNEANITVANQNYLMEVSLEIAEQSKEAWEETITYDYHQFEDYELRRMFKMYSLLGEAALPEDLNARLIQAVTNMQSNYATAKICSYSDPTKCDLPLEPDVTDIFADSQDPEELKHAWVQWHRAAGAVSKGNFTEYVQLKNEAAKLNNFDNVAEWWLGEYESEDFEEQMSKIWEQIKPLYQQIHAYVRYHLRLQYGENVVSATGPIPAHLLGNIWGQTWSSVESYSRPYPDKADIDVTGALVAQNYTAMRMFEMSDEFFQSLNLTAMPPKFWQNSIIEKPSDGRELVCHASAWDFYDGEDFRIKQCTSITESFFQTTHHEMGHIQYYLQYKDQPVIFRGGANPGFHEAVGDVIALSVTSTKHLKKVGLIPEENADDEETQINQLYRMGLEKIVFLPFAYMLDLYRYSVFRGESTTSDYNCRYWQLREAIQGLEPPVERSEEDFDAAAKYHVSADVEYARYYVSFVVQFQFHQALCSLAGEFAAGDATKRLVDCDIYNSTNAGNALSKMLSMGSSRPWPDAMQVLTGQRDMDASGLFEYFQPLYDWLKQENEKNGAHIGWTPSTVRYCTDEQKSKLPSEY